MCYGAGMNRFPLPLAVLLAAACNLPGTVQPIAVVQEAFRHAVAPEAMAVALDTRCDDQPDTYDEALAALTVPVHETRVTAGSLMATPMVLLVPRGWGDRTEAEKLPVLREELAHYCQRRTFPGFDQLWLTGYIDAPCRVEAGRCVGPVVPRSDFRAAFEVAAKRAAGQTPGPNFVSKYLLHDLEPDSLAEMVAGP
jgi:hypothetical protein